MRIELTRRSLKTNIRDLAYSKTYLRVFIFKINDFFLILKLRKKSKVPSVLYSVNGFVNDLCAICEKKNSLKMM